MTDTEIQIVPLTASHVLDIVADGIVECNLRVTDPNDAVRQVAKDYANHAASVTALWEGRPLFCVVLKIPWPGVGEIGALISTRFRQHKFTGCRAIRGVLDDMMAIHHLHRVHTTVRCDFPEGKAFIEWLGFQPEGVARKYTHDQVDATYYAFLR